jgi:hypothetical protein
MNSHVEGGMTSQENQNFDNKNPSVVKAEYEKFEDLKEFILDDKFEDLLNNTLKNLFDENNWYNQFEAVNDLRRLNKFHFDIFDCIFEKIVSNLAKLTSSIRSNLSKISLMLIKEFFNIRSYLRESKQSLKLLINCLVTQSSSMKSFIKEEALGGLDNLASNMEFYSPCIVNILIEECSNKSPQSSENAFNANIKILNNWVKEDIFSGTNHNDWENILMRVINLHSMKKEPYLKRACRLVEVIYNKFGSEDFELLVSQLTFGESNKQHLFTIVKEGESKKKDSKVSTGLKNFINKK